MFSAVAENLAQGGNEVSVLIGLTQDPPSLSLQVLIVHKFFQTAEVRMSATLGPLTGAYLAAG
jgi:hypothetical protein